MANNSVSLNLCKSNRAVIEVCSHFQCNNYKIDGSQPSHQDFMLAVLQWGPSLTFLPNMAAHIHIRRVLFVTSQQSCQNEQPQFKSHRWIFLRKPGGISPHLSIFVASQPDVFYRNLDHLHPERVDQYRHLKPNRDVFRTLTNWFCAWA